MSWKLREPVHFSIVRRENTTFLVKERYKETILSMSLAKNFFRVGKGVDVNEKFGRGIYLSIPDPKNSGERFIIRNYRHGGLLGKFFAGVFYDINRPLNELHVNEVATLKDVPSAEVIAIAIRKLWGIFYKADFISREVSGAIDIIQFLKESSPEFIQKSKKPITFALARLIRNMHDAGIFHADLHLKNILLKGDTNGEFNAYIIDLDKSAVVEELNIVQRMKNLLRLDRYIEKLRLLSGATKIFKEDANAKENLYEDSLSQSVPQNDRSGEKIAHVSISQKIRLISKADKIRFFKWYILYNNTLDKDWKKYVRQYHSQHVMHKLWWRLLGLW
ncbi:MAG: hypothetical protein HRF42_11465 [Candidatus Brocadia sp.]|jgi:serine/threonine protein kinase